MIASTVARARAAWGRRRWRACASPCALHGARHGCECSRRAGLAAAIGPVLMIIAWAKSRHPYEIEVFFAVAAFVAWGFFLKSLG